MRVRRWLIGPSLGGVGEEGRANGAGKGGANGAGGGWSDAGARVGNGCSMDGNGG